jgi:acyl-CoA synthetase (AMP-forming)/AMP-acid ligase II
MPPFKTSSEYVPTGDQPAAVGKLAESIKGGERFQTLLGATGTGKTATMAWLIEEIQKPTLIIAHNKTLAAQLCNEFREFFPKNRVEYFEPCWAAQRSGLIFTCINSHFNAEEVAYILQDSDAKAFISHERYAALVSAAADEAGIPAANRLAHGTVPGFRSFDEVVDPQPTSAPENRATGAAMHYTSGTTGKPKGVKRALADIEPDTSAELFTFLLGLFGITHNEGNVHLCTSPNYHTAVTTFAGNSLHMKHTVVCMDKWDAEETLRLIERYRCSHTHMVPTQFIRLLQLPDDVKARYDVSAMKYAIHAAAPCPVDTKRRMLEWWGPVIWEYYAATEGGGTVCPPEEWLQFPGTVGTVWPNSTLKIADTDGNPGSGALFHPLRLALTARENGPEMARLLPLIGRANTVARLAGKAA